MVAAAAHQQAGVSHCLRTGIWPVFHLVLRCHAGLLHCGLMFFGPFSDRPNRILYNPDQRGSVRPNLSPKPGAACRVLPSAGNHPSLSAQLLKLLEKHLNQLVQIIQGANVNNDKLLEQLI